MTAIKNKHNAVFDVFLQRLVNNRYDAIALFDQPVNSVSYFSNELYIGGSFQRYLGDTVNFLGKIPTTVGLENETISDINLNVYPNPFNSTINLEGIEDGATYSIFSIDGRTAKSGTVLNEKIDNLDFLPKGTYLLRLETAEGIVVKKIFK